MLACIFTGQQMVMFILALRVDTIPVSSSVLMCRYCCVLFIAAEIFPFSI